MTSPGEVLETQADLAQRFRRPSDGLVRYIYDYACDTEQRHAGVSGGSAAAAMFYPTTANTSLREAAMWCSLTGRDLELGMTYQVTDEMVDVLQSVYAKTMQVGVEHIQAAEMPSETGFLWYDKPLIMTDVHGKMVSIRAVSWGPQAMNLPWKDGLGRDTTIRQDGVRIALWCMDGDPSEYMAMSTPRQREVGLALLGPLQLDHVMTFPYGTDFNLVSESNGDASSALHYVHVTFMMLQSEIAVNHQPVIPRGTRRRIAKSINHSDVTVVTLRRAAEERNGQNGHREVDWSCRWFVQGHHRHLESYEDDRHRAIPAEGGKSCSVCGARITWVRPALKGPSWLPVKQSKVVHRLSR